MRAALIHERGGGPILGEVPEAEAEPGTLKVKVRAAGLQPTDILRSKGLYKAPALPYIAGGGGVGTVDGRVVYFGQPIASSGALADWAVVPAEEVWDLPDGVDEAQAIAFGATGTGALIPLEEAKIAPGEQVLILGATGPLGQIALQVARLLGAGRVVAAARGREALERVKARGLADAIVVLGQGDDTAALKAGAAGAGFNVVLDCIYGPPAEAAMRATAVEARMMSIGIAAGMTVTLTLAELVRRSHHGVSTGHRPVAERRAAFNRLVGWHRQGQLNVDVVAFDMSDVGEAWAAQAGSPGSKVVVRVAR